MSESPRNIGMKLPHLGDSIQTEKLDVGAQVRKGVADPTGVGRGLKAYDAGQKTV